MKPDITEIRKDREINLLIEKGNEVLRELGYTEHSRKHAAKEAETAGMILKERNMELEQILTVTAAIGHHDEGTGTAIDPVSAALILADKTDVRRNRVQNPNKAKFDIHDRVNYAALSSNLKIDQEKRLIQMNLELDDSICSLMDYFEIFLERMLMCKRAAECLNCRFRLVANGSKLC